MRVAEGDLGQGREITKIGRGSAADREIIHIETGIETETGTVTVTEVGEIGQSMAEAIETGAGVVIGTDPLKV